MSKKYFGKETIAAIDNFKISNYKMPKVLIESIIEIKRAAAIANYKLGKLSLSKKSLIVKTCDHLIEKYNIDYFPIDVFQTGSGTSSNMNVNELISNMASEKGKISIHPNDEVNYGQSSNCVIPSAINISNIIKTSLLLKEIKLLITSFENLCKKNQDVVKIGRTHLQDAVPMTIKQEFSAYISAMSNSVENLGYITSKLLYLPIGGTAIGTRLASSLKFSDLTIKELSKRLSINFKRSKNTFYQISLREEQVLLMNFLSTLSSTLIKISNDLRLLSSGPNTGLGEISFAKLQAGSSIMPGKVNPVIMEAMIQVCAVVIGRGTAVNLGNQNGPLQLNMMMPMIAFLTNDSLEILTNAIKTFREKGIAKIKFNKAKIENFIAKSTSIITVLKNHPKIGYDKAAELVEISKKNNKNIVDVLLEAQILTKAEINKIFNFKNMTRGEDE